MDNNSDSEFLEPVILTLRSKTRKNFPDIMVDKIIESSLSKNLDSLKELMPKKLQNINIKSALLEFRIPDRSKIKVDIRTAISLQNSLIISNKVAQLDKAGHISFVYLKSISKDNM